MLAIVDIVLLVLFTVDLKVYLNLIAAVHDSYFPYSEGGDAQAFWLYLNKRLPELIAQSQDSISEATTAAFGSVKNTFGKSNSGK